MSDYRRLKRPFKRKMTQRQEVVLAQYVKDAERFTHVIGVDEVGTGACAGPLCVAAVVLPWVFENPGFKDSKRFTTDKSRLRGSEFAKENTLAFEVMFSPSNDVETYGPAKALSYIQRKVVHKLLLRYPKALVVVDGNKMIYGLDKAVQLALPKADALIPAVSAASIIAKVARDTFMVTLGVVYPVFEFHKNKGYPTTEHRAKLKEFGPTVYHRMNIYMVRNALQEKGWYLNDKEKVHPCI